MFQAFYMGDITKKVTKKGEGNNSTAFWAAPYYF